MWRYYDPATRPSTPQNNTPRLVRAQVGQPQSKLGRYWLVVALCVTKFGIGKIIPEYLISKGIRETLMAIILTDALKG